MCEHLATLQQYRQMQQTLNAVVKTVQGLRDTVSLFQRLMHVEEVESADVDQAMRQSKRLLNPIARRNNISIILKREDSPFPPVAGSTVALQQVLLNLILNAIQHIPAARSQNGTITVEPTVESTAQGSCLHISIHDNGPGIHKKLWGQIFDLGYTTRADGTGQGLYIARSLVESIGGCLRIDDSTIHLGTTFTIELPILRHIQR